MNFQSCDGEIDGPSPGTRPQNRTTPENKPDVAILGAGPAGAAAALSLARTAKANLTLIERNNHVGGNAASFLADGVWCDHGSHRLHPVADPRVLDDVRTLLGDDLLLRPRHGRIRLQGRWIHFPLKPVDLLLRLPKPFTAALAIDAVRKLLPREKPAEQNFATVLRHGLGPAMSESFYYPYVRKLWGQAPENLAVTLAERRVSGNSVFKILQKVARQIPGFRSEISGSFYYPKKGFGQITNGLAEAAVRHGAKLELDASVVRILHENQKITGVEFERNGESQSLSVDAVWSTLPISLAVKLLSPAAPKHVLDAAGSIKFRGMILIYLVLEQNRFSEYDAHYFPELSMPISRMSEPKNYSAATEPQGTTILCAELPCDPGDPYWALSPEDLGEKMCAWLASVDLPVTAKVRRTFTRKLRFAYPVYDLDYERQFDILDDYLSGFDGMLTYGRQGLFAHDNTHHAMTMAYAASDCFSHDGKFDKQKWARHRDEFKSHVVED